MKIWTLENKTSTPELFEKVKVKGVETLASFRVRLETKEVVEWEFDFKDTKYKRRIRKKVERLINVYEHVYIICTEVLTAIQLNGVV